MADQKDGKIPSASASPEAYAGMNEKEKDAEIARSIIRIQTRIQKILYLSEIEWARTVGRQTPEKKKSS